jgi:hypothetical protein
LGPWLIGQTNTFYEDPQTWPDLADASLDAGIMQSGIVRKPQVRYTWLGGNGLSIGGSAEMASYNTGTLSQAIGFGSGGAITGLSPNNSASGSTSTQAAGASSGLLGPGYVNWPKFVAAAQWDQPWGHLKLAAIGGLDEIRGANTAGNGGTGAKPLNTQNAEYAFSLTGHVNTWGKDRLAGGIRYNNAASDYSDDMGFGEIYNTVTGQRTATKELGIYANYEHFFTTEWRANASMGWAHMTGNPGFTATAATAGLQRQDLTAHVNAIFAPIPNLDIITEWMHDQRKVQSGASGRTDRIEEQFKFYF